ncbi:MAG TPA: peptidylprolyl isomerase [Chloroflexota bacterium]|nr:peptidylprolyl isomerase [Chloroflexota bacterium]
MTVQTEDKRPAVVRRSPNRAPSGAPTRQSPPRQKAVHVANRRDGNSMALGWGSQLTRAEKEQVKGRLAFLGLSAVVALALLLMGGALLWDKVVVARQPVLRVDGQAVPLQHYAALLSYRRNVLQNEFMQASEMASQPTPPGTDPSQNFMATYGRQRMQQIQGMLPNLDSQLLEELIGQHLIRAEAQKRNITVTPADIEKELKLMVGYQEPEAASSAGTDGAAAPPPAARARGAETFESKFKEYRRLTGGSEALIRADVENQFLRREFEKQLADAVPTRAEQIKVSHILVQDEETAKQALQRIRNGEPFAAVAAELSLDPGTKDKGGELGWFSRGLLAKEFEDAAFALQPGQISDVVKTNFGWHIILLQDRDPNRELEGQSLSAVKQRALPQWLEQEEKNHKIERLLNDDMIDWAQRNAHEPASARRR